MNYQEKQSTVIEFYSKFIEDFICKDLEVLNAIEPNKDTGLAGCTIPTAMAVIASMDFLGFLLNEKANTGDSSQNISYFIFYSINSNRLFPGQYDGIVVDKISNYRHGMMHHFFPKFKGRYAGICKSDSEPNIIVYNNVDGSYEESLNVSVLCIDFLNAVKTLKNYLEKAPDEKVLDSILRGLKNLDYSLRIHPQVTVTTTVNPGTPKNKS